MNKLRYGVIGIGGVGRLHARLAKQHHNLKLIALADPDQDLLKQQTTNLGVRGFSDYRKLLDANIVDAVSIATPHHLHAPIGIDCLNAGVHIFMEKPLANKLSEAQALVNAAGDRALKVCVGHQYRTFRTAQAMKRLLDNGAIGEVLRVLWSWVDFRPASYYKEKPWRASIETAGGGVLINQASHDLDLISWLLGTPKEVSAMIGNQFQDTNVEDVACVNVVFENGALGSLQFSINQPRAFSIRQIAGSKGMIAIPDVKSLTGDRVDEILLGKYAEDVETLYRNQMGIDERPSIDWQKVKSQGQQNLWTTLKNRLPILPCSRQDPVKIGHQALLDSFVEAILHDRKPLVDGQSACETVEFLNAIILSAVKRKTVSLPLDSTEYDEVHTRLCARKEMTGVISIEN